MMRRNRSRYLNIGLFLLGLLPLQLIHASEHYQHLLDITQAQGLDLSMPSDVVVGKSGNIYIVDGGNHRLLTFSDNGAFIRSVGHQGSGNQEFDGPLGIGIDGDENLYVADAGNHRIQVFNRNSKYLHSIAVVRKGQGQRPIDVAVAKDGRLYITSNKSHSLMVYTKAGKFLRQWGGKGNNPGEFRYPATLDIGHDGNINVVDVLNSRVQIFQPSGELVTHAGSWGVLPGQLFRPKGVTLDAQDNIYISDSYMNVIEVFNNKKQFQYVLGGLNSKLQFNTPAGIYIDKHKRLYVTQMLANKVSVLRPVR